MLTWKFVESFLFLVEKGNLNLKWVNLTQKRPKIYEACPKVSFKEKSWGARLKDGFLFSNQNFPHRVKVS